MLGETPAKLRMCVPFGENRKVQGREVWGQNRERRLLVKVSCVPVEEEERAESLRKLGEGEGEGEGEDSIKREA